MTDHIEAIRAHVEKHAGKERATFSIAGIEALLAELDGRPLPPEWQKQQGGATVATIREHDYGLLEVMKLSSGNYSLVIHQRVGETDRFDDLSIELEPKHFVALGALAKDPARAADAATVKRNTAEALFAAGPAGRTVTVGYTNWRGEHAMRKIIPLSMWFGSTLWHPEPQWLVKALDVEKDAERDFALSGFDSQAEITS